MGLFDFLPSRKRIKALEGQVQYLQARSSVRSGTEITFGKFEREYNTQLKGDTKWDTYAKMQADPHVKASLDAAILPLLTAEWTISPASDDQRDVEIAEFCEANLLRRSGDTYGRRYWCGISWRQRLFEILDMLASGFAMHHKSWRVEGDKVVYDRLTWLEPSSIDDYEGWLIDESSGDLQGITREFTTNSGNYVREVVNMDDLMLYPWELRGQQWDGRPQLRSLYGPWFRKDFMARIAAINVQKIGSPVPLVWYPQDLTNQSADFEELAKLLRGQSPDHGYFAGPMGSGGVKPMVEWASPGANEVDRVGTLIDRENLEMAHGAGRKAQMLGETTSGSRALAESQMSAETLRWQAIAEWVCEVETHGSGPLPGLIEELVDRNYSGVEQYPRLTASKIDPQEQAAKLEALVKAKSAGLIPMHPDVMRQVAHMVGIDLSDDVFEEEMQRREEMVREIGQGPPESDDDARPARSEDGAPDNQEAAAALADSGEALRRRLADLLTPVQEGAPTGGRFRYPNHFEAAFVDLAGIADRQRRADAEVAVVLRRVHRGAIDELLGRLGTKLVPRNIESQRRSKFRGARRYKRRLEDVLTEIGGDGAAEAAAELERQMNPGRAELVDPGDVKIGKGGVLKRFLTVFDDFIAVTVSLTIERIWSRVIDEGVDEYERLVRQQLDDEETESRLTSFMDELSEKPVESLARKAGTVSYNAGRDMTLRTAHARDIATHMVRSEILDERTCGPCRLLDATVYEIGSPEYFENYPPAKCEGFDLCRGVPLGFSRAMLDRPPRGVMV